MLRLALLMIASQINKSESSNMPLQPLLWAGSWRACVASAFSNAGGKPSLCSGRGACRGCQAQLAPPALRMVGEDTSPHTAPAGVSPEQGTAAAR